MAEPRDEALRLLCAHLRAAEAIAAGLMKQDAPEPEPPVDEPELELACPHCGEKRLEKLEEFMQADEGGRLSPRVTCLACGKSFNPKPEEEAVHG